MKQFFHVLSLLLLASMVSTSCLNSNDDDVSYYDDAAIIDFTLGTINRYQHTISSKTGNDTVVKSTITGSKYKMSIDQLGMKVFNRDSLPIGCDAAHVLCSVTAKNSGGIALKNTTDSLFTWFSSRDSIDFTQPRIFRIIATDASYYRDYEVSLNVAKQTGTNFYWEYATDNTLLAGFGGMRAVTLGNKVVVFGEKEGHTCAVASVNGTQWTQLGSNINTLFDADAWQNVVVKNGMVYMLSGNMLLSTADGENWQQVADGSQLQQLVGAATEELYALGKDGNLKASTDNGLTWNDEQLDDLAALLPTQGLASVSFPYAPSDFTDYVLLVGNDGERTRVWRKITQYGEKQKGGQWVNMTVTNSFSENRLPLQQQLSMVKYDGKVLVVGSTKAIYQTLDQGVTWSKATGYALPSTISGERLAMAVNGQSALWMVTNAGQVWIGRKH